MCQVEAERLRESLPELLQHANFVTTSSHYPAVCAPPSL